MNELNTLSKISELIEPMAADSQRRVMAYLNDKYGAACKPPTEKRQFNLVEGLNFHPKTRNSARSVAENFEKNLRRENKQIKCLIAIHYLSDYLTQDRYATDEDLEKAVPVNTDQVATFFHEVGWELPADLKNTIAQTGKEGWIVSSDTADLKTTEHGRDLLDDRDQKYFRGKHFLGEPLRPFPQ